MLQGYGIMRGMSTPPPEGARPRGWQRSSRPPAASVQGDNALDENDNIKVVARIRPMNEREAHAGGAVAVTMADNAANCVQARTRSLYLYVYPAATSIQDPGGVFIRALPQLPD